MRIGIISDTHGLLRPEALRRLRGSDLILHAGDIGSAELLVELESIAPVKAVRGNNDEGRWAKGLPETLNVKLAQGRIFLLHSRADLDFDPAAAGYRAVVSGHSHQPSIVEENGVLFINPGSAGPRRFKLPIALATLEILGKKWRAAWHALAPEAVKPRPGRRLVD